MWVIRLIATLSASKAFTKGAHIAHGAFDSLGTGFVKKNCSIERGVTTGVSPIVLRRGYTIEVTLDNPRRFAVTVDDAATAAPFLNVLVTRLPPEGCLTPPRLLVA